MVSNEMPDRCPDCDRQLVKESNFVFCSDCEFVIDLQESPEDE